MHLTKTTFIYKDDRNSEEKKITMFHNIDASELWNKFVVWLHYTKERTAKSFKTWLKQIFVNNHFYTSREYKTLLIDSVDFITLSN